MDWANFRTLHITTQGGEWCQYEEGDEKRGEMGSKKAEEGRKGGKWGRHRWNIKKAGVTDRFKEEKRKSGIRYGWYGEEHTLPPSFFAIRPLAHYSDLVATALTSPAIPYRAIDLSHYSHTQFKSQQIYSFSLLSVCVWGVYVCLCGVCVFVCVCRS